MELNQPRFGEIMGSNSWTLRTWDINGIFGDINGIIMVYYGLNDGMICWHNDRIYRIILGY
jgi:hypothetical protein